MIIRHGEKPGDPANDDDGGPHLATLGSGRAAALPYLFTPDPNAQMPVANWEQLSCDLATGTKNAVPNTSHPCWRGSETDAIRYCPLMSRYVR